MEWIPFIVNMVFAFIFGGITKAINESKGYAGGFAWGFWLGIIGILVVAFRRPVYSPPTKSIIIPEHEEILPPQAVSQPDSPEGWQCTCGRFHPRYVTSCVCGNNKHDALNPKTQSDTQDAAEPVDETKNIAALKEYKQLLDDGVLTQEEFDEKKKAILSR